MTTPTIVTTITLPMIVAADVLALARAASSFTGLRRQANELTRIVGEAMAIEVDHGEGAADTPLVLLFELLEGVALHSRRVFVQTADRTGLDHALAALADMSPALGATEASGALGVIRETLRQPPLSYQMVDRSGAKVGEPVDCHTFPLEGRALVSPDGTRRRVLAVAEHVGSPTATVMVGDTDGW